MTDFFKVGGAIADITPDRPLPNYGGQLLHPFAEPSPLLSHVLVCTHDSTTVALLSVDCTFADRNLVLRIRDELRRRTGIIPDNILVSASHNHSTPATAASFLSGALPDPLYLDHLISKIGDAAEASVRNLQPAVMAAGKLMAPGFVHCRRRISPAGQSYMLPDANESCQYPGENEIDREMQFLAFERPDGTPVAAMINFACHNNITFGLEFFHGDMFWRAGQIIRNRLGESIPTLLLPAPCGEIGWCGPDLAPAVSGENEDSRSWSAGRAIADSFLEAFRVARRQNVGHLTAISNVHLIDDRSLEDSDFCYDGCRGSSQQTLARIRRRFDPEREAVMARRATSCVVELRALTFGPVAIVTNPAELFSTYGRAIKSQSPFEVTLVSELTNGYCGYVPTVEAFEHRGYETHRTVYTSRLVKNAGEEITRLSIALLAQALSRSGGRNPAPMRAAK